MSKSIEDKYKKLDDISHVLLRPGMYVGSIKPHTSNKWLYDNGKFEKKNITYIPGFIKLFDEIITNSVDEHKREGTKLDVIKVNIDRDKNEISVWDNGGIPVLKHKEHDEWIPEMIFSSLKAGSNFNDDESRTGAGTNGVGSSLVNIFSTKFIVKTCDGKNHYEQTFTNNMRDRSDASIKKSTKNYTEIIYTPDLEKFGMNKIDEDHYQILRKRVYDIAGTNPSIKVYFNGEPIGIKSFEDYIKFYTPEYFYESNKDKSWSIGIAHSTDGWQHVSFVNSVDTYDGGEHVDYIMSQVIAGLREFFQKKHKVDIKPAELKNHMFLFLNSTIVNPAFSSQTKEKLITEVKNFGYTYEVSDKLIKSILKSEIVNSILDWIQQKKNADENKLARELNKSIAKAKVDKLIDAKGRERWKCSLSIFEGDSANSAFRKFRQPELQGSFALKGKFVNASEMTNSKLVENKEAVNLIAALGLKLGQKVVPGTLRYGKIYLYMDADTDGHSIVGLMINFFHKYWPELFEQGVIWRAETPLVVAKNSKLKKKIPFYTNEDWEKWCSENDLKGWDIEYKKGLASLEDDEYREIICNPVLTKITPDEASKDSLNIWFGKDSDLRKNELLK